MYLHYCHTMEHCRIAFYLLPQNEPVDNLIFQAHFCFFCNKIERLVNSVIQTTFTSLLGFYAISFHWHKAGM